MFRGPLWHLSDLLLRFSGRQGILDPGRAPFLAATILFPAQGPQSTNNGLLTQGHLRQFRSLVSLVLPTRGDVRTAVGTESQTEATARGQWAEGTSAGYQKDSPGSHRQPAQGAMSNKLTLGGEGRGRGKIRKVPSTTRFLISSLPPSLPPSPPPPPPFPSRSLH